jgi:hypothetical protein
MLHQLSFINLKISLEFSEEMRNTAGVALKAGTA